MKLLELENNAGRFWCWRYSGGTCIHTPSPLKACGTHVTAGKKKRANLGDFLLFFLCVLAISATITCVYWWWFFTTLGKEMWRSQIEASEVCCCHREVGFAAVIRGEGHMDGLALFLLFLFDEANGFVKSRDLFTLWLAACMCMCVFSFF